MREEVEVQLFGAKLSGEIELKVLKTLGDTECEDNTCCMMTTLSYLPDSNDKCMTMVEKQLYNYLQSCIGKKSGREKVRDQ